MIVYPYGKFLSGPNKKRPSSGQPRGKSIVKEREVIITRQFDFIQKNRPALTADHLLGERNDIGFIITDRIKNYTLGVRK